MRISRRAGLTGAAALALAGPASAQDGHPAPDGVASEMLSFQSHGRAIRAVAFRPVQSNGAGVVYLHGAGGMQADQLAFARRFALDGYLSLAPLYLDAAADDGVRREPVMEAWRDCGRDAVEWLIGQGINRRRTGVTGYSLGAYVAVDGALGDSRAAAAVGICGGWDVYAPRHPARRVPVLLIRSELDRVVSPDSTQRWRQFLADADIPVSVQVTRGAGHHMNAAQWTEVYTRSQTFFADRLGVA